MEMRRENRKPVYNIILLFILLAMIHSNCKNVANVESRIPTTKTDGSEANVKFASLIPSSLGTAIADKELISKEAEPIDYELTFKQHKEYGTKLLSETEGYSDLPKDLLDAYTFAYAYQKTKAVYDEYEGRNKLENKEYRGIIFDLIDNDAKPHILGTYGNIDKVSGYSLASLRVSLREVSSWEQLRDQLIQDAKSNVDAKAIHTLFDHYK